MSVITLTTDFGTRDWFVGAMKGVIAKFAPKANVIDLTHEIPAGDLRGGAFALMASCRFFPKGTVHLAVVDPGVGTSRLAIAVQTADFFFLGPDNGVLSWALAREKIKAIRVLENERYFLRPVSGTFHGRDIFAPVAAHLCRGVPIRKFGPAQEDIIHLHWPKSRLRHLGIKGEVLYLDRFGNAITNIEAATLCSLGKRALKVLLDQNRSCPIAAFYQSVPPGRPVAVVGSSGFLEIAINGGNAAQQLGLRVGQAVTVRA